jgi:hypothetical protein
MTDSLSEAPSQSGRNQAEDHGGDVLAERLRQEATGLKVVAPPSLHLQIMESVRPRIPIGAGQGKSGGGRFLMRLWAGGAAVAAVLMLLAVWDSRQSSVEEWGRGKEAAHGGSVMAWLDYMAMPDQAEVPIHDAAAQMFAAEYERLGQDIRSATDFVRSTSWGWIPGPWAAD